MAKGTGTVIDVGDDLAELLRRVLDPDDFASRHAFEVDARDALERWERVRTTKVGDAPPEQVAQGNLSR